MTVTIKTIIMIVMIRTIIIILTIRTIIMIVTIRTIIMIVTIRTIIMIVTIRTITLTCLNCKFNIFSEEMWSIASPKHFARISKIMPDAKRIAQVLRMAH